MLDVGAAWEAHAQEIVKYLYARGASDPEDMCATVFLEACERAETYQERGYLRGWLYRIARSRMCDERRAYKRHPLLPIEDVASTIDPPDVNRVWCEELVRAANLTRPQQQAVYWNIICDRSLEESAALIGTTVGGVKALRHRALARLAQAVDMPVSVGAPTPTEVCDNAPRCVLCGGPVAGRGFCEKHLWAVTKAERTAASECEA